MAISMTPSISEWKKQEKGFLLYLEAYDENGERCIGEQLAIRYGVSYDGTSPIAENIVNSNAEGNIIITISRECKITLYASYAIDIHDTSKGKVEQEIVTDYEFTFEPYITKIDVSYLGKAISITDNYDPEDLKITVFYSDQTTREIPYLWCDISGYMITTIGENIFYLSYSDIHSNIRLDTMFTVIGVEKLLSISASYIGGELKIGERIHEDFVKVSGKFLIDINTEIEKEITGWSFLTIPIVPDLDVGNIQIQLEYQGKITAINVPCIHDPNKPRLNIWYEGLPIEPVNPFLVDNIRAFLIEPNGKRYRIPNSSISFDNQIVSKEGWNWFTAEYREDIITIKQQFPVLGVIPKKYIDLPFKVLYIKDDKEIDMTSDFWNTMDTGGVLSITWQKFLDEVNRQAIEEHNPCYGKFLVTVPKLSGLSRQYDTLWEVICINEHSIKALLKKSYYEEVNDE